MSYFQSYIKGLTYPLKKDISLKTLLENKFKEFIEMTMSYGQMQDLPMPDFSDAKHIGDVEHHKILYKKIEGIDFYGIAIEDKPVAYLQTQQKIIKNNNYEEINIAYTLPEFRNQNLAKKLIFFLRNALQKSFLLGDKQSRAGQSLAQSLAKTQKFPMSWINVKTGEKQPYSPEQDNFNAAPYRSLSNITDWQIVIETVDKPSFPQFIPEDFKGKDWHLKYVEWFD